jgi:hypothetical protein
MKLTHADVLRLNGVSETDHVSVRMLDVHDAWYCCRYKVARVWKHLEVLRPNKVREERARVIWKEEFVARSGHYQSRLYKIIFVGKWINVGHHGAELRCVEPIRNVALDVVAHGVTGTTVNFVLPGHNLLNLHVRHDGNERLNSFVNCSCQPRHPARKTDSDNRTRACCFHATYHPRFEAPDKMN